MRSALQPRSQRYDGEGGFTLTELTLVIAIIGILIAIATPSFVGAEARAGEMAPRSSLRDALAAAKASFTDQNSYATLTTGMLSSAESSLTFQVTPARSAKQVELVANDANDVILSSAAASTKCYYLTDSTKYENGYAVENGNCTAAAQPDILTAAPQDGAAVASAPGTAPTWYSSW